MSVYHIIVKTSLNPDWGQRLISFWESLKASGIKTDEKVLYLDDDSQVELVYSLAAENNINIVLKKEQ